MKTRALKLVVTPSLAVLLAGGALPLAAQEAAPLDAEAALVQRAEQEQIKRMETSLALSTSLDEAGKLVQVKDYTKARARYQSVIEQATGGGANADIRARAQKELAALASLQAREAERERKFPQARSLWQEAVALDPSNPAYAAGLRGVEAKDPPLSKQYGGNSAATPELLEKVTQIQKLLFEGDSFHSSGQYQRAISRYKEILTIDPYHKVARQRIERTEKAKYRAATVLREAQREKALLEVDEASTTKPMLRRQAVAELQVDQGSSSNVANVFEKLERIVIPELNFTDVDVADAVRFLVEQSKALDPERKGVNFVLKVHSTAPPAPPTPATPGAPAPPQQAPTVQRTFSLNLRQVPLLEVLRFITNLTNLQFKVEEHAVYIFPSTETSDVLVVRSFSVPPNFFSSRPQPRGEVGATGAETVEFVTADVKQELEQKGVSFPSGATAAYLPRSAKLIVRNTLDQITLIGQLLAEQSDVTTQIEIETKFLEFTDDKLKELAFNYRLYGDTNIPNDLTAVFFGKNNFLGFEPGTNQSVNPLLPDNGKSQILGESNLRDSSTANRLLQSNLDAILGTDVQRNTSLFSASAILSGNGAGMFIRALESQLGADLLSAPKVTVVNGQKTKIRVARELRYPTEYEPPEVTVGQTSSGTTLVSRTLPPVVVPSNPSDFETRDVGVTLEVKADATKDRRIDLEIVPEVNEFQGFINYGADATSISVSEGGVTDGLTVVAEGQALTPVFALRKVETKVQVVDGQTVVMGGFIREDNAEINDKVPLLGDIPLLGRLFRSKTSRAIKRNLIIFTTARIINPDGTPKFLTESEADAIETLGVTPVQ
jgi:general secretion pathway protein D